MQNILKKMRVKKKNTDYLENKERNRAKNKIKRIENDIENKEKQIKEIQEKMTSDEICTNYVKLNELQQQINLIEQEIEQKMQEWEELSQFIEE